MRNHQSDDVSLLFKTLQWLLNLMRTLSHGLSDLKWTDPLHLLTHHPSLTNDLPILHAPAISSEPAVSFKTSFHPRDFEFLIFSSLFPHYSNLGPNVTLSERPRVTSASWWSRHFPYIVLKASRAGKPHNLKPSRTVGHPWVLYPKYRRPSHPLSCCYITFPISMRIGSLAPRMVSDK